MSSPSRMINGYEILAQQGRNGLAAYYKARHVHVAVHRFVMLKVLGQRTPVSAHQRQIILMETQVLARMQHPNILALYDVGESDHLCYMALEWVEGPSLANRLAGAPQYTRPTARLLRTLALAVHYIHEQGVIHRDLKPANILLAPDPEGRSEFGIPKLTDFELALPLKDERPSVELVRAIIGTPAYMAPEQVLGLHRDIGRATDVYGLGVILYEMLTGRRPFHGSKTLELLQQTISAEPEPIRATQPHVPAELEAICLRCLRKDPAHRYPTAAALAVALQQFLDDTA